MNTLKQNRIHSTLRIIVQIAPTSLFELYPILVDYFPHKRHALVLQSEYTTQLLVLCNQWQSLQHKILDLIISKCIEIDVEIIIEDTGDAVVQSNKEGDDGYIDIDNPDNAMNTTDIFQLDDNGNNNNRDSNNINESNGITIISEAKRISNDVSEQADKLDIMLSLVMKYISDQIENGTVETKTRLFYNIMIIFEERIMNIFRSKFVQYIVFYMCSIDASCGMFFSNRLLEHFNSPKKHILERQSAVLYLASFLSRAKYMPRHFVRYVKTLYMLICTYLCTTVSHCTF